MRYLKLFEDYSNEVPHILPIQKKDINEILAFSSTIFSTDTGMTYEECMGYTNESTDWSKSVKLILGDKIIGCYLVKEAELEEFPDKKGIEGVALCILPEYRGKGYGEKMKDWLENYAKSHGYDYIYGMHLKTLKNIEPWLKRRELYKEDEELYHTIKWLK